MDRDEKNMLPVGATLNGGRYEVISLLGSGGFGNTYKVRRTFDGDVFAMKEFFIDGMNERRGSTVIVSNEKNKETFESQKSKFRVEAERLRDLSNAHIVKVHDFFPDNGTYYYVMDYLEGASLGKRVKPLIEEETWGVLYQVLDALSAIHKVKATVGGHERIWVHLDVTPSNLMMDDSGKVTLIDFGASKQVSPGNNNHSLSLSQVPYTRGYAPGEQIYQDKESIGPWTDFYALGATLYALQTSIGTEIPSYSRLNEMNAIKHGIEEAFVFPSSMSQRMRDLIVWMMNPIREKRPHSVSDIGDFIKKQGKKVSDVTGFNYILTIEIEPQSGGRVRVDPEREEYDDGEDVTCTAVPHNCYSFSGWYDAKGEKLGTGKNYSFVIKDNTKLYAKFGTRKRFPWIYYIIIAFLIFIPITIFTLSQTVSYQKKVFVQDGMDKNKSYEKKTVTKIDSKEIDDVLDGFSDGLVPVRNKKGKCGFIDAERTIKIPFLFENASGFSEGLAAVKNDKGEIGYINKDGEMVIGYTKIRGGDKFYDSRAVIKNENGIGVIDKNGKYVVQPSNDWIPWGGYHYQEGVLTFIKDNPSKVGCYDLNGDVIIPPIKTIIGGFNEGLAAYANFDENDYGYIDKNNNIKFHGFSDAAPFSDGLASVTKNNQDMYIDKSGSVKFVLPPNMHCYRFSEGLARGRYTDNETFFEHVYIDKNGKVKFRFKYDNEDTFDEYVYGDFHEGMARVNNKEGWGYIDRNGKKQIDNIYDYAEDFENGYALVKKDGKHFLIDKNGNDIFR